MGSCHLVPLKLGWMLREKLGPSLCSTPVVGVQTWKNRQAQIKVGMASDAETMLAHVRSVDDKQAVDHPRIRWP